jgi:hypothetical protein
MKRLKTVLLLLATALLVLTLDHLWLYPRVAHADGPLKVYVQEAPEKRWTDIQGSQIVGFSCGPEFHGNRSQCYVASR